MGRAGGERVGAAIARLPGVERAMDYRTVTTAGTGPLGPRPS